MYNNTTFICLHRTQFCNKAYKFRVQVTANSNIYSNLNVEAKIGQRHLMTSRRDSTAILTYCHYPLCIHIFYSDNNNTKNSLMTNLQQ